MMLFFSALLIGLVSSFHCVGMCGPIALGMSVANPRRTWLYPFFYNLGRVFSYTFMGLLVGILGRGIVLSSSQQFLSISLGLLLILVYCLPKSYITPFHFLKWTYRATFWFRKQLPQRSNPYKVPLSIFRGFLNGFLPCGSVYLALAGALATGSTLEGILYMFIFGLGTFPLMFLVSWMGSSLKPQLRHILYKKLTPILIFTLAFLFIIRGLNLSIPYLSPQISKSTTISQSVECCELE